MGGTTKQVSTTPRETQVLRNSLIDAFMSGNVRDPYASGNIGNNPYNQSWMNASRTASMDAYEKARSRGNLLGAVRHYRDAQGMEGAGPDANFLNMLNGGIFARGPSLDSFADPNGALFTSIRGGYDDMFSANRAAALAQAKEASGNLTGSGYAANLGGVVNRSIGEQNALMSSILTQLALAQYGQENSNAQNNAQRFITMLSQLSGQGVAPNTIVQSGGIGEILGPIAQFAGQYFGVNGGTNG